MNVINWKTTICEIHGKATVDGVVVAEATLMCVIPDSRTA